jgi:transcriptional regulator of heat shock response
VKEEKVENDNGEEATHFLTILRQKKKQKKRSAMEHTAEGGKIKIRPRKELFYGSIMSGSKNMKRRSENKSSAVSLFGPRNLCSKHQKVITTVN